MASAARETCAARPSVLLSRPSCGLGAKASTADASAAAAFDTCSATSSDRCGCGKAVISNSLDCAGSSTEASSLGSFGDSVGGVFCRCSSSSSWIDFSSFNLLSRLSAPISCSPAHDVGLGIGVATALRFLLGEAEEGPLRIMKSLSEAVPPCFRPPRARDGDGLCNLGPPVADGELPLGLVSMKSPGTLMPNTAKPSVYLLAATGELLKSGKTLCRAGEGAE